MVVAVLGSSSAPSASHDHHALILVSSLLISILSSNTVTFSAAQTSNISEIDRQALLSFKSGISSDPLDVLGQWRSDSLSFCDWRGVSCGTALPSRVVSLDLYSMQLGGKLSFCIANLTSLVRINLRNNHLSGGIPEELGTLAQLQTLMLAGNNLAGNIPLSFSANTSLSYINLANNSLIGGIPSSLENSSSLVRLILSNNRLTGEIPPTLFDGSSKLLVVDLQNNMFSGPIPNFYKMTTLKILGLSTNSLSGKIPSSLGNVSSLTSILLAQNNLAGSIPESLSHIAKLEVLDFSFNILSGHVPPMLYNISSLQHFGIGHNILIGCIPSDIGNSLPNLQKLIMKQNNFKGLIPASLANVSKLRVLDLSNNLLSGPVPSLGSLSYLTKLFLDGNGLNGSMPRMVGNLSTSLQLLVLGENRIWGAIPNEIGNLVNLTLLDMEHNLLSEGIPSTIGILQNLVILKLSGNRLSSQIPPSLGNLTQLSQLYLDNNNLNGSIPASLGSFKRLAILNLSMNNLGGQIPGKILGIASLSLGLDLSHNNLIGPILPQVGELINLGVLNVSRNQLSGEIPSALGQCVVLTSLRMEGNMFQGSIPRSFSKLKAIQRIDLSRNNLSGPIPQFFEDFASLDYLNLSYNDFEGQVPTNGCFRNSTAVLLGGNKRLCAIVPMLTLPLCSTNSVTKGNKNARLLLIVTPPVTIALLSLLCFIITLLKGREVPTSPLYKETMKKVSYSDILKATNWFSPINKISSSCTASVYIGRFELETDLVAIKTFYLDEHGTHNSFFTECEVLRSTRHRNLIQAVTVCSTVNSENNEFKAIVYEFMANGSLDMWVHPKQHRNSPKRALSLGQRISIATDVASALDYIHNQLIPPLIHCDLKPSNILLDYDMTARVGDFGSAKFLSSSLNSPEGMISVGGTLGYIAPEYGVGCKISTRCDVYSFGILLLEMLTGKRPTDAMFSNELSLHKYVDSSLPDRVGEILDRHMPREDNQWHETVWMETCIVPLIKVGLLCSIESPKDRPGMRVVCAKISAIKEAFLVLS